MSKSEAVRAVWEAVAATLRAQIDARAIYLERATAEETAQMYAAAESVRRAASRLSKPTKTQRHGGR